MIIKPYIYYFLFIAIVAIPLFAHLDSSPLTEWDEARLSSNSFEMYTSHNLLVPTYRNSPEMWQLKPPLLNWFQVISMKVFGINELALRLPSAIAALATCFLIFYFFKKKINTPLLGLLSVAVLVTTDGYIHQHTARSCEYDSLLTMFTTGYIIFFFLYIDGGQKKYIYITFILIILAALTKGIQGLLFLPALFLYTIYKKKLIITLKQKEFYIGLVGFLFFVFGYYLLRDNYNPGYINAVLQSELGRYNVVLEDHRGNYLDWIIHEQFQLWYLYVLPGFLLGIFSKNNTLRDFAIFTATVVIVYLAVISKCQTKLWWYTMPLFPFLSVFVGVAIYNILLLIKKTPFLKQKIFLNLSTIVLLIAIFTYPYFAMLKIVYSPRQGYGSTKEAKDMELFLQDVLHNKVNIDGFKIVNPGLDYQLWWYYEVLKYQNRPIQRIEEKDLVQKSLVIAYKPESKLFIESHYNNEIIRKYSNVTEYKLYDRKQSN